MLEGSPNTPGLVVLSIDGGGIRGLSPLLILKECMSRLQHQLGLERPPEVYEHFDIIGGAGTGGVSAAMLGRLRIPLDQTIEHFAQLAKDVFSDKKHISTSSGGTLKSTKLQQALKDIVRKTTGDENEMMIDRQVDTGKCKTVVFAMSKHNMNLGLPRAFRSYEAPANQMPDCTIWEALCASTAHPDLFKSIDIGEGSIKESFVDGGLGCSNPLAHILSEVKLVYPGRHVGCIVSIGSGHACTIHIPKFGPVRRILPRNMIEIMKGIAADSERVAQEMTVRFNGAPEVYFRFNVDQGMQSVELDAWEQLDEVMAHTRAYMQQPAVSKTITRSATAIKAKAKVILTSHIDGEIPTTMPDQMSLSGAKVCPLPTSLFVEREQPVQQAATYLLGGIDRKVFVLHGLGGSGKTQAALRIVQKTREHWSDIVYVDAVSVETIETALKDFAVLKHVGGTHQDALRWLTSHHSRWLLVFDNADNPEIDILKYIPRSAHGSILITTRNQELVDLALGTGSDCNVSGMDPSEALQLLLKISRMENPKEDEIRTAKALLQDFGYLPLAIIQAGGYIKRAQCSFSQYYEIYQKQPEKMLQSHSHIRMQLDKYERTIFDAWLLSYILLSVCAQQLLWILAYMQRDRITLEIFRRAALNVNAFAPVLQLSTSESEVYDYVKKFLGSFLDSEGNWDCDAFLSVIGEVLSCSLIEFDRANQTYVLHPLVQAWARTVIPHREAAPLHTAYILAASLNWGTGTEDHDFCRSLQLHVSSVLPHCPTITSDIVACFSQVLYENGQSGEAPSLQADVPQLGRGVLNEGNPDASSAPRGLSLNNNDQGLLKRAEKLQVIVLNARKKSLGDNHPETLSAMVRLAGNYCEQGRTSEAEGLQLHVLEARKQALGEEHSDTLSAMNCLANTYRDQGDWKKAEDLWAQVLNTRKQVLGEEHPETLDAMNNLAVAYSDRGMLNQATELRLQVLNTRKRLFGDEHSDTLSAMNNLADSYRDLGRLDQAEELQVKALAGIERVFRKDDRKRLVIMNNLGLTYTAQGRYGQAEELQVQLLDIMKPIYGEEHPYTLTIMNILANTYSHRGSAKKAKELRAKVLDARKRVLGEKHPDTLISMSNLANTYHEQGLLKEAEELQTIVLHERKKTLGEDHPDTLAIMNNFSVICYDQGRLKQAEDLQIQTINAMKRVLGEEHPDTLSAMNNLANTYCKQGLLTETKELQVQVLDARKRVLGELHLDTLISMINLSNTYLDQKLWTQAGELGAQAVDSLKLVHGEGHPHTLTAMSNLVIAYIGQGHLEKAGELQSEVFEGTRRTLGEEHPSTIQAAERLALFYRALGVNI